jgi:hypothetical protein
MKKISFILALVLFSAVFTPAQAAQTKCKDGTYSSSTGRGTCSSHGGVASSSSAEYDKIVARIKKNYGITINGTTSLINVAAAEANLKRQNENAKADAARAAADKAIKAKADAAARLLGFKNAADQAQAEKIAEDKRIAAEKAEQQLIETELEIARIKAEAEAEVLRIQNAKILEDKLNAEKISAQAKVQGAIYAEKMEKENKRLNPNNARQYVMPHSNFTLCDQYGGQYYSDKKCVGFVVCEQQLVNSGYTVPFGNNTSSSLDMWLRMGQLVQTPDNPTCALIKGNPVAPKGK